MDHFLNRVVQEQQGQGRIRRPRAPRAPRAPRQPRQPRPRPYQYPPVVPEQQQQPLPLPRPHVPGTGPSTMVLPDLMSVLLEPPPLVTINQDETHASTAQAEQEDDDYEIISLSPSESVQEDDGHDPIVAPSSPQEDLFEEEIPAQAAVEKYSAPTVRVQEPLFEPEQSTTSQSGKNFNLLRALYEVGPSTSQNRLPTPPSTTPPLQHPEPEVSSEVTDPIEGLFLGLGKIQNNYEERLNSLYVDLKSAGVELVENILEMDQKRKVAVEKLEQIYANISDVRAALKNIREQKNKKK